MTKFYPGESDIVRTPKLNGLSGRVLKANVDIHVSTYGAVGGGVTNDRLAVQAALNAASALGGGTVRLGPLPYNCSGGDLTIPENVYLVGGHAGTGEQYWITQPAKRGDFSALPYALYVDPDSLRTRSLCGISGVAIIKFGLPFPATLRAAITELRTWTGTGLTVGDTIFNEGNDVSATDLFIMGFGQGIKSSGNERFRFERIFGDCINGIWVDGSSDTAVAMRCHFWPFLIGHRPGFEPEYAISGAADNGSGLIRITSAAHVIETGDTVHVKDVGGVTGAIGRFVATKISTTVIDLQGSVFGGTYTSGGSLYLSEGAIREGVAYRAESLTGVRTDWVQFQNCTSFGYDEPFLFGDMAYDCMAIGMGADTRQDYRDLGTIGVHIKGSAARIKIIGGMISSAGRPVVIDSTDNDSHEFHAVNITGHPNATTGIEVKQGAVAVFGGRLVPERVYMWDAAKSCRLNSMDFTANFTVAGESNAARARCIQSACRYGTYQADAILRGGRSMLGSVDVSGGLNDWLLVGQDGAVVIGPVANSSTVPIRRMRANTGAATTSVLGYDDWIMKNDALSELVAARIEVQAAGTVAGAEGSTFLLGTMIAGVYTERLRVDATNFHIKSAAQITGALAASGAVTGSNLSGTNTGDQTTITGNAGTATTLQTSRNFSITGGGITAAAQAFNGSAAVVLSASVDAGHVTLARMADMATASLIYRKTAGTGVPEVQTLATLKTDLGLTGSNSGDQTITLTGPVTGSGTGSFATTITDGAVTLAKQANMATASLVYRKTAGSGAPEVQTLATLKTDLGLTGSNSGDQTITLTGNVTGSGTGSFATTIADGVVTLAKQANVATGTVFYRKTAASGAPEVQTLATLKTDLLLTGTNSGDQTSIVGITGTLAQFNTAITDANIPQASTDLTDSASLYKSGGTDVALADGGTGASLTDPNADRLMFWDDSASAVTWLTLGTNLSITGTTLDATGGGGGVTDGDKGDIVVSASGATWTVDPVTGTGNFVRSNAPTLTGMALVQDIMSIRSGAATTGIIFLGDSGARYLFYDGSGYSLAGAPLTAPNVLVTDEAYDATAWNGSLQVPTKNAVRDKIEALSLAAGVSTTRLINTTAPLTGGGDLSADRTLAISAATSGAAGSMSAADKTKIDAITGTNTGDETAATIRTKLGRVSYILSGAAHSNSTTTSTTVTDGTTPWTHTCVAGKTYKFMVTGTYQTAALTTGMRLSLLNSTAAGQLNGTAWGSIAQATVATGLEATIFAFATSTTVWPAGSSVLTTAVNPINSPHALGMEFTFRCTTSGTVSIQFASEVAASAAQINIGSALVVEELN